MFQNGTSWILVSVSVMHPKSAAKVRKKSGLYKFMGGFLQNKFILHEKWRGNENMNTYFCVNEVNGEIRKADLAENMTKISLFSCTFGKLYVTLQAIWRRYQKRSNLHNNVTHIESFVGG